MDEFKGRVALIVMGGTFTIFLFTMFSTQSWTKDYVDSRHSQVIGILIEIKQDIKDIKRRVRENRDGRTR